MATVTIECPECQARLKITDLEPGTRIRCPKCKNPFAVSEDDEEEVLPKAKSLGPKPGSAREPNPPLYDNEECVKAGPARKAERQPRHDEDEDRPARKAVRSRDEDDEEQERPRPKLRRGVARADEDDEEYDRPRRKKGKKRQNSSVLLWSLIGGGGAALVGGIILLIVLLQGSGNNSKKDSFGGGPNGKPSPEWTAEPALLGELDPEAVIDGGYRIRPPKGYKLSQQTNGNAKYYYWNGPKRPDSTPSLSVFVTTGNPQKGSLEKAQANVLAALKNNYRSVTSSTPEHGSIAGIPFIRTRIQGTIRGKNLQGVNFTAYDGTTLIAINYLDIEPHHLETFKVAEAAALTFRKI